MPDSITTPVAAERLTTMTCADFAGALAARTSVPGGGGAAAYVGSLAAALASMVGEFTVGKPRYAEGEADVRAAMSVASDLRSELLALVDEDARAYSVVSAAYAMDREDPARPAAIGDALSVAAEPPARILEACARVVAALEVMAEKGSRLLRSDVACGAAMAAAAMRCASASLYVNTASMPDRVRALELEARCDDLVGKWAPRADALFSSVVATERGSR